MWLWERNDFSNSEIRVAPVPPKSQLDPTYDPGGDVECCETLTMDGRMDDNICLTKHMSPVQGLQMTVFKQYFDVITTRIARI